MSMGSERENEAKRDERRHEFRAGAVFYGGVSLAIYENGVARAFHDACTNAGLFGPLLELIGTRFIVDVISGSSAGGINGLLLAASLEHGTDFSRTAELWRKHGGIGELLRPADAKRPASLLQGETYYLRQLRNAFKDICTQKYPLNGVEPPQEIDVFVTGTDLNGSIGHFMDALDNHVQTKTHRLVFHLKHRHDRKSLGYMQPEAAGAVEEKTQVSTTEDRNLQADILASIARITSSFPGAFPPFTVREFSADEQHAQDVRHALEQLCEQDFSGNPELVDGGVLDNRPFGPLLDAVFHRMPFRGTRGVTRRVFYVDPDPDVFKLEKREFTPLAVAVNSVVALPSYDSITTDVKSVVAHNTRISRLQAARKRLADAQARPDPNDPLYCYALERELLGLLSGLEDSCQRSPDDEMEQDPGDAPSDQKAAKRPALAPDAGVNALRRLDIGYHMRRAVSLFYGYAAEAGAPALTTDQNPETSYEVGRVVKALKLLRDVWVSELARVRKKYERDRLEDLDQAEKARNAPGDRPKNTAPKKAKWPSLAWRLHLLERYVGGEWVPQRESLTQISSADLKSQPLSERAREARKWLREELRKEPADFAEKAGMSLSPSPPGAPTLLDLLENQLDEMLGGRQRLHEFATKDCLLFPLELASETQELDEVQLIRISPGDPSLPEARDDRGNRIKIAGRSKLTGDELAHFSAFLRQDFRTNDVAWGHVDGIERIVRGLLQNPEARKRAAKRLPIWGAAFAANTVLKRLKAEEAKARETNPEKPEIWSDPALQQSLKRIEIALEKCRAEGSDLSRSTWQTFVDAFITAAQTAAAHEYIALIHQDAATQDRAFNWPEAPLLERKAGTALEQLVALRRGDAPVLKALPPSIIVEYASQAAILLWGMIERSIAKSVKTSDADKESSGGPLLAAARPYVIGPLNIIHTVAALIRIQRRVAELLLFGTFVGSLGLMASILFGAPAKVVLLGLLGILICGFWAQIVLSKGWRSGLKLSSAGLALATLIWFVITAELTVVLPWSTKRYSLSVLDRTDNDVAQPATSAQLPTASK